MQHKLEIQCQLRVECRLLLHFLLQMCGNELAGAAAGCAVAAVMNAVGRFSGLLLLPLLQKHLGRAAALHSELRERLDLFCSLLYLGTHRTVTL